jgi:hypothetical protein
MKLSRIRITVAGAALLFTSSAFAADTNKGTLRPSEDVNVGGTPLRAGNYKVEWNGSGPDVQVTLHQGRKTVATFPAHLTEQKEAMTADAYGSVAQPHGQKELTAIYFGDKHYALQVEPGTAQDQQNNSNAGK